MSANHLPIAAALLAWYDRHRRRLPWRAGPGETADPYRVWISEIMLQQTVAATVAPYFLRFVARWPTIEALAGAEIGDVLTEWAGLGYYARGRNLHACAQAVVNRFGGNLPADPEALRSLPGIGAYTAGAIAAIAFGLPVAAVDGNVERVVSRLRRIEQPLPSSRPGLRQEAEALVPPTRPGDFAQAMMDLGATICTPRAPKCLACPISAWCEAFKAGVAGKLPAKTAKPDRPTRRGRVWWIVNEAGEVLVRRRESRGLLGGMMEFPSSEWKAGHDQASPIPPFAARWTLLEGSVVHIFTHFRLELDVAVGHGGNFALAGEWIDPARLGSVALPSVMRKVAAHVEKHYKNESCLTGWQPLPIRPK